jgi:hypothetical protein
MKKTFTDATHTFVTGVDMSGKARIEFCSEDVFMVLRWSAH